MVTIKIPAKYCEQAAQFFNVYVEEKFAECPEQKMKGLALASQRRCRFCGRRGGEATFRNDAHIIPYALGNKFLVSDFECDECNNKFGRYENDLVNYLGIERTILRTPGRKKMPGFLSRDLIGSKEKILDSFEAIKIEGKNSESTFNYDPITGQTTLLYTKPPYVPINVYRAFLKMALSLISEADVPKYSKAFKFLLSENPISQFKRLPLCCYRLPNAYQQPFALLFRKLDENLSATTHSFVLFYGSFMFQIFLPFNSDDIRHYKLMTVPVMPPLFDGSGDEKWNHLYYTITDMSSNEIKNDDKELLSYKIAEEDYNNSVGIDLTTKKVIEGQYDRSNVAAIVIVGKDFNFKLDSIS